MSYEKPIRKPQVPPGLDEFEPNRLHAGLNDLQAAKGAHRLVYTHPSEDVDKLNFQWCEDIGYLYSKDTKTVKIFTSFNYDGDKLSVGTVTVYPRSVVKKIEVLK